jgi:myo-inositol 2-dehydrogenase/D-chiro-inositol 1-dehydrogenase
MTEPKPNRPSAPSRREFLKTTAAATAAAGLAAVPSVHAAGSDVIKVGLIGCGGRGTGAAEQSAASDSNIKIYALADMFQDRLDAAQGHLKKLNDKFDVSTDRCFTGFDAYKKLLATDVDLVILATPPGFRPAHIAATIDAGKHLFTEKPVGVDGPGIRQVLAAAEKAKEKNLAVVAGTQRRHQKCYLESMKRIHDGAIGEVRAARVFWNQGGLWMKPRESSWSDMEWQLRNWLYFTWLSGDHICEQHVHNLDVANWALGAHPESCVGMGGRQVRTSQAYGHIFDHFAIDYKYPGDVHVLSMCRQIDGCAQDVSEYVVGTKGQWHGDSNWRTHRISGSSDWRLPRDYKEKDPYYQEHIDLVESIRAGRPLNELRQVAESTLTAIMGRMSAYTGKAITWDEALNSEHKWAPDNLSLDASLPIPPVPVPGESRFG